METYELESEIYDALINNAELISLLPLHEKAICHHAAPSIDPSRYPIIVYTPISDVPALSGDNREVAHRVTMKIYVITKGRSTKPKDENFKKICVLVKEIMTGLNFVRRQTGSNVDDGNLIVVLEFVKNILC